MSGSFLTTLCPIMSVIINRHSADEHLGYFLSFALQTKLSDFLHTYDFAHLRYHLQNKFLERGLLP